MNELVTIDAFRQDEERFITDLIETKGANLPATIGDVVEVFEFTDWKAKAWKTLADKMAKLEDQQEAYHSALRSGQNWGIAALYAQKRMGEITKDIPTEYDASDLPPDRMKSDGPREKAGLKFHAYNDAERIASHPEVLDSVIERAKEHNEIPTRTSVLNEIRMQSAKTSAKRHNEREMGKVVKSKPRVVVEYFDSIKAHREVAEVALAAAKKGMFSAESVNIIKKKHGELCTLYAQIEAAIGGNNE